MSNFIDVVNDSRVSANFIDVVSDSQVPANSIARHTLIKGPLTYKASLVTAPGTWAFTDPLVFPPDALAPLPPDGEEDNLLLESVKSDALTLTFPVPSKIRQPDQDTVQLLVDGSGIGSPVTFSGFKPGDTFSIELPAIARPEGRHSITYQVKYYEGGGLERGPAQQFEVDLTAPGRPFLGRLSVDQDIIDNGLTADKLKESEDGTFYLESFVPSYEGVQPGDIIQGLINGEKAPNSKVINIEASDEDVELPFVREDIEAAGDGPLAFSYEITDRAGNLSLLTIPLDLRVLLKGELTGLEAPQVPSFEDDGIINETDARGPAEVIIPAFTGTPGIQKGDQIQLVWGGRVHTLVPIPEDTEEEAHTVQADYAALYDTWKAATGGANMVARIDVLYRIVRNTLVAGTSPATVVDINLFQAGGDPDPEKPIHPNMHPALLTSASGKENEIPVDDFDKDATIIVRWFQRLMPTEDLFNLNDVLKVTYGKTDLPVRTITATDVANKVDLVLTLTKEQIRGEGSGEKTLKYTVTRTVAGGTENTSYSPLQPVQVSGSDELPGEGTLPEGSFTPLNDRNSIGPEQIKAGVKFVTPHYINKKTGDTIKIDLVQYMGDKHDDDSETPIEETRITMEATVGPDDENTTTEFQLDATKLAHPLDLCHIHAVWSAKNTFGTVINDKTQVTIDSRGYDS
ncbi:hypothetical protein [Pseudomonas oryzicola]|uniref:Uncharacterized protein n=1 Tax=Pseudomonas oryzicola TaxID=485876 RepID=A0ABS6Q8U8_9PSED|nr:hypothetical protein [Pseudomonas oryzicola]MBV4490603.1 hypothetical protein [Pseudomonas oryzicola]